MPLKKNIKELKYRVAPWSRNSLYIVFPKRQNSGTTCYSCKNTPRDLASWEMIKEVQGWKQSKSDPGWAAVVMKNRKTDGMGNYLIRKMKLRS